MEVQRYSKSPVATDQSPWRHILADKSQRHHAYQWDLLSQDSRRPWGIISYSLYAVGRMSALLNRHYSQKTTPLLTSYAARLGFPAELRQLRNLITSIMKTQEMLPLVYSHYSYIYNILKGHKFNAETVTQIPIYTNLCISHSYNTICKHLGSHNALKYRQLVDLFFQRAWRWPNKGRNMSPRQYTIFIVYKIMCCVIDWHVIFILYNTLNRKMFEMPP